MTEDELEAGSIRYVTGVRLALLSSGRIALWYSGPQGLSECKIVDMYIPAELVQPLQQDYLARQAQAQAKAKVSISLEDLDL